MATDFVTSKAPVVGGMFSCESLKLKSPCLGYWRLQMIGALSFCRYKIAKIGVSVSKNSSGPDPIQFSGY